MALRSVGTGVGGVMLVMRALATTLAGLTVAAGVITAPFEQQLRTVARVQDGARNVADVTFDVTYSIGLLVS